MILQRNKGKKEVAFSAASFYDIPTAGGRQKVKFIDEGNLYRLIAGSRLPSAERFESWIFDELVPRTLKEGGYLLGKKGETDAELLSRTLMLAENKLKERDRHISELKKENALNALRLGLQAPKIRYFDEVLIIKHLYAHTDRQGAGHEREGTEPETESSWHPVPPKRNLAAHCTLSEGRIYTDPYAQLAEPQRGNRHGHAYGVDREGPSVHPLPQ